MQKLKLLAFREEVVKCVMASINHQLLIHFRFYGCYSATDSQAVPFRIEFIYGSSNCCFGICTNLHIFTSNCCNFSSRFCLLFSVCLFFAAAAAAAFFRQHFCNIYSSSKQLKTIFYFCCKLWVVRCAWKFLLTWN